MINDVYNHAVAGVRQIGTEPQVLQSLAIHTMRTRGGYIPEQLHVDGIIIDRSVIDDRPLCHPAAQMHLILMLEGYQHQLLEEWLRVVVKRRERVPEQLIPALLEVGYRRNLLRSAIKRLAGKRALWLQTQAHRETWRWLNQTTRSLASEARPGIARRQADFCEYLQGNGLTHSVCRELAKHQSTWGDELMRSFFGALQQTIEHDTRDNHIVFLNEALITCASFIPLERAGDYAGAMGVCIQDLTTDDTRRVWQRRLQDICEVLDFRRQMHTALRYPVLHHNRTL
ncbi:MAG: DUF5691 domain-containing protein [Aggregatilineales bacterium]